MQISSFNGGLNKRLSPFLLQSNEGVKYSNIDTTTGALAPLKENKDLNAKIKPNFTYFNGHWVDSDENRDYVKFQDKLFYSNGLTRPQWSEDGFTWYGLGIDKPEKAPKVTASLSPSKPTIEIIKGELGGVMSFNPLIGAGFKVDSQFICDFVNSQLTVDGETIPVRVVKKFNFLKPFNPFSSGFKLSFYQPNYNVNSSKVYYKKIEDTEYSRLLYYTVATADGDHLYVYGSSALQPSDTPDKEYLDDLDTIDFEGKTLDILGIEVSDNGVENVYSTKFDVPKIEILRNLDTEVPVEFLQSLKISPIGSAVKELKLFINGINFTTVKGKDGNFYTIGEYTSLTVEKYLESESLSAISYCYTYSSDDGIESLPSESQSVPDKFYPAYIDVVASEDKQVTTIKLYRQNSSVGGEYQLVKEFPNVTQQIVDDKPDSLIDGAVLASYNNLPAPDGLQYMTLYNTMLFGSIKDKLYYTDVASPFSWSGFNFIDFDDTITGIGGTSNGLLVFTRHSTYIVTGTSPDTFSKYLLSSGVGCILHKSIQSLQNTLLWLSEDSICASNGGSIQTLSRDKLNVLELATPRCSAVLNDVYYISYNSGTIIADFRFGLTFRESDKVYYGLAVKDNSLYGVEAGDKFVEVNKGSSNLTLNYVSPKFSDGSMSTLKTYKDIYFYSTGDLTVKVYIDDSLAGEKELTKGYTEIKVDSEKTQGYNIQFEVQGTGTLNEIEYKVEVRQNGR